MMGLLQAGGVALDDVSLLRGDEGLELLGGMPAANTMGDFLRRFGNRTIYTIMVQNLVLPRRKCTVRPPLLGCKTAIAVLPERGLAARGFGCG